MKQYILAHDLGTSGNKATLFSSEGKLAGSCVYEYPTYYFDGLCVEQDAEDWWRAVCDSSKQIIRELGVDKKEIAAISFSGQMMGCLCVDKEGNPLRRSIIWADQRAQKQAAAIEEKLPMRDFYHITGHRNTASYGIQKLMWIRDNEPEVFENTYKTLNAKDFIVARLTGKFYTEPTDATGNNCMDLMNMQWSERILDIAGIGADKLPDIRPSTFIAGGVTKEAAHSVGLLPGTPVVLGGGDGVCANIGAGSYKEGRSFSYVGSSAWVATTTGEPLFDEQMRTITWAHIVPGLYTPNGTMQTAGGSYNWLKNTLCTDEVEKAKAMGISPYELINEQIEQSPPGANGVVYLPYLLGERAPRWNPNAKGSFVGLGMQTTRADILRSVLEGVTMNLGIILDILRQKADIKELLVIGGGAKGRCWRQMMADIYGVTVRAPKLLEEATSMGAAVTGGVGVGVFKDFGVIDDFIEIDCEQRQDMDTGKDYARSRKIFDMCYDALRPVFDRMANKQGD